jgi:hypothetical protein
MSLKQSARSHKPQVMSYEIQAHRRERLLKQQMSYTLYHLPTKEIKLPFSVYICKRKTEPYIYIYIYVYVYIYIYIHIHVHIRTHYHIHIHIHLHIHKYVFCRFKRKQKTEAQAFFLNPSTVCPSYKRKVVIRPFVDEETN